MLSSPRSSPLAEQKEPTPSPSVVCVGGMLRVVTDPAEATSVQPALEPSLPADNNDSPLTVAGQPVLTQKQVRELRRLCRKTANRAEFDDRLIQVRQIASIAAMGTPSAPFFDPHNPQSGCALRLWVDQQREQGADWRDERPLPDDAIDELRRWDRALKVWARLRFETSPHRSSSGAYLASTSTPSRTPGLGKSASPITPYTGKSRQSSSEYTQFSSPVSPDAAAIDSSPVKATDVPQMQTDEDVTSKPPLRPMRSFVKRQPLSEVSITRVGDTINITVPTIPMTKTAATNENVETHARNTALDDQENVYPPMIRRQSYVHAANTAKSWRSTNSGATETDKEFAYRTAAKTLFSGPKEKPMAPSSSNTGQMTQRSAMDWGKLRRPVLKTLSLNTNMGHQSLSKPSK